MNPKKHKCWECDKVLIGEHEWAIYFDDFGESKTFFAELQSEGIRSAWDQHTLSNGASKYVVRWWPNADRTTIRGKEQIHELV